MPVLTVVPKVPVKEVPADGNEAPVTRIVAVPGMGQDGASTEPKPSGTAAAVALAMPVLKALPRASVSTVEASKPSGGDRLAAVVAFLRGRSGEGAPGRLRCPSSDHGSPCASSGRIVSSLQAG
jgi:hypothetical protein